MSWSREREVTTDRRSELEKKDERFPGRLHSGVPGGQDLVYSFQIVWSCQSDSDRLKVILSGGHESGRHHQAEQAQRRQGRGRNGVLTDLALCTKQPFHRFSEEFKVICSGVLPVRPSWPFRQRVPQLG